MTVYIDNHVYQENFILLDIIRDSEDFKLFQKTAPVFLAIMSKQFNMPCPEGKSYYETVQEIIFQLTSCLCELIRDQPEKHYTVSSGRIMISYTPLKTKSSINISLIVS